MINKPDKSKFDSNPAFNAWIDSQFAESNGGDLSILGKVLRPSEVLHQLSFDAYEAAFPQFRKFREQNVVEKVTEQFPINIAYPFSRFLEGSENNIQKLQFLRDTWEGLINFIHAIVIGEARHDKMDLTIPLPAGNLKCGNILSDKLNDRIQTIEGVLQLATQTGVTFEVAKLFDPALISIIRDLNQTRNAFSHTAALSEDQALQYINECYDDVCDVLEGFVGLTSVRLLRYDRLNGVKMRHERFDGHSNTRRFIETQVTSTMISASLPLLVSEETLLMIGGKLFSLRPLLHFMPIGQVTHVGYLKKAKGDAPDRKIVFELVGESKEVEENRIQFQAAINEIRALFKQPPE